MRFTATPLKSLDYRRYIDAIKDELDDLRLEVKAEFEDVVNDWEHAPDFRATTYVNQASIWITVSPTGPNAQIWRWVDEGTKPHVIMPRGRGPLRFRTGYWPRTWGAVAHYGNGQATGPFVSTHVVHHPGTTKREFTLTIRNKYAATFAREVQNAIAVAAKG